MKSMKQLRIAVILLFVIVCGFFYWNVSSHRDEPGKSNEDASLQLTDSDDVKEENRSEDEPGPDYDSTTDVDESVVTITDDKFSNESNSEDTLLGVAEPESWVLVHVCGAVKYPGVYRLNADARVIDALDAAGGMKKDAAEEQLNQAACIWDGEQIYVPTREEVDAGKDFPSISAQTGTNQNAEVSSDIGLININTANKEQLMSLPGIGASKADAIISYRKENGSFQKIEDLMQVPGIKEGTYRGLKEKITIGTK